MSRWFAVALLCVLLASIIATQVYAAVNGLYPADPAAAIWIPVGDWMTSFVAVAVGVYVAYVLSDRQGRRSARLAHIVSELTDTRAKCDNLRITIENYMDNGSSEDREIILTIFHDIQSRINVISAMSAKKRNVESMRHMPSLRSYFSKLRDIVTGDNWCTRNFTMQERKAIRLYSGKIQSVLNNMLVSSFE